MDRLTLEEIAEADGQSIEDAIAFMEALRSEWRRLADEIGIPWNSAATMSSEYSFSTARLDFADYYANAAAVQMAARRNPPMPRSKKLRIRRKWLKQAMPELQRCLRHVAKVGWVPMVRPPGEPYGLMSDVTREQCINDDLGELLEAGNDG